MLHSQMAKVLQYDQYNTMIMMLLFLRHTSDLWDGTSQILMAVSVFFPNGWDVCVGGEGGGFLLLHFYKREHLRPLNWNILHLSSNIANQLGRALKGPSNVTDKVTKKHVIYPQVITRSKNAYITFKNLHLSYVSFLLIFARLCKYQ